MVCFQQALFCTVHVLLAAVGVLVISADPSDSGWHLLLELYPAGMSDGLIVAPHRNVYGALNDGIKSCLLKLPMGLHLELPNSC